MEISGSNTLNVEMTDTNFSGAVMGYDEDIMNVPGNFGASFENPMYDEMVSIDYFVIKTCCHIKHISKIWMIDFALKVLEQTSNGKS